ncbi:MAG: hypothetical protein KDD61_15750 [Bdellovibrionales bacterium]|nr:hypothetical protein [Bdellovibrionales bacterium]
MKTILIILLLLLGVGTVLFFFESHRFNQWLKNGHQKIRNHQGVGTQVDVQTLPLLLQNYLQKVLVGKPSISYIEFTQSGDFRMTPKDEMAPFTAEQIVSVRSPMFSWVAKIPMNGLPITVCDRLIDEQGELQARLFSAIPLAKGSGDRFLRGELLRYLAEIPWYPMAILNQPNIEWQQSEENKVKGTLSMKRISATVEYTFNDKGLIESIFVPDREKIDGQNIEQRPWLGEFSQYDERSGVIIPTRGQVSWLLSEGKFTYFVGNVTSYKMMGK